MKRLTQVSAVLLAISLFLAVSGSEREVLESENTQWCDLVSEGVWYSSEDEFNQRCGE